MFLKRKPHFRNDAVNAGSSDTVQLTAEQIESANAEAKKLEENGGAPKEVVDQEKEFDFESEKPAVTTEPGNLDDLPASMDEMEEETTTPEEKAKKEKAKPDEKKPVIAETEVEVDAEFELQPPAVEAAKPAEEEVASFSYIAKEAGLGELKADDFDNFKVTLAEKLAAERKAGKEEALSLNIMEEFPAEVQAEAKEALALLRAGKSLTSLVAPLKPYEDVLAMSSEDKLRAMFSGQGHNAEWIDNEIERQRDSGTIEHVAQQITTNVTNMMNKKRSELIAEAEVSVKNVQETIKQERAKEDAAIIEELRRRSSYIGGKLNDKTKEYLEAKWKNGDYRRRLKSEPAFVVDAMLYAEFGKTAEKELRETEFAKGRGIAREKLHNTKKGVGAEGGRHTPGTAVAEGFDAWEEMYKAEEQGVSVERVK